ncbi:hypothetical protein [Halarcobacter sp.]|uniref:hypothetical protein n=1 Tax=Halarcobacter sp. TaxID=2321133 RepID=UPI003AFFE0BC
MRHCEDKLLIDSKVLLKKFKKKDFNIFEYILESYKKDFEYFHRVFLHSGIVFLIDTRIYDMMIEFIDKNKQYDSYKVDFLFLQHTMNSYENLDVEIKKLKRDKSSENVLAYFEYAFSNLEVNDIGFEKRLTPREILLSQKSFLLSNWSSMVLELKDTFIGENKFSFSPIFYSLYDDIKSLTFKQSLKTHILSFCMERYTCILCEIEQKENNYYLKCGSKYTITIDGEFLDSLGSLKQIFLLVHNENFSKENEVYRDLSLKIYAEKLLTIEEDLEVGSLSDYIHYDKEKDFMHIKGQNVDSYMKNKHRKEIDKELYLLFGDISKESFEYADTKYYISELVELLLKIEKYSNCYLKQNIENFESRNRCYFDIVGLKKLYRILSLTEKEKNLIGLFISDINIVSEKELNNKPIIKIDQLYYIFPSILSDINIETLVENILSHKDIEKTLSIKKGYKFEENLEGLFNKYEILFYKLNKDELLDSPEIDGMFIYDNHLFLYEAKASILPTNVMESYNYLNDILYNKAYNQLEKRIEYILNNKSMVEKKFNINIDENKILPLIMVNHGAMFGYKEFYSKKINKHIPILDINTLKYFLENKTVIQWDYNYLTREYSYNNVDKVFSAEEFHDFLINPSKFLKESEQGTIQFNEQGIGFFIVKSLDIEKKV